MDTDVYKRQAEDRLTVGTGSPNPNKETVPSYTDWTFNLTWKDACDDADFESFSINGVNGVIDDSDPDNRTITVNPVSYTHLDVYKRQVLVVLAVVFVKEYRKNRKSARGQEAKELPAQEKDDTDDPEGLF